MQRPSKASAAKPAPAAPGGAAAALCIGICAYESSPLRNPVNDATDMAAALRDAGFDVTLVLDARNLDELLIALDGFCSRLRPQGTALFFFAGHGVQGEDGVNYMLPTEEVRAARCRIGAARSRPRGLVPGAGGTSCCWTHAGASRRGWSAARAPARCAAWRAWRRRTARSSPSRARRAPRRATATGATACLRRTCCGI